MPEFIDPVFTITSPKRSFSVIQNERFGLVIAKTGSIISGTSLKLTAVSHLKKQHTSSRCYIKTVARFITLAKSIA